MDPRNVADLSSFLLFECTGDSEEDSDLNTASLSEEMEVDDEADDAQSSCCDTSDGMISYELYDSSHLDGLEENDDDDDDDGCYRNGKDDDDSHNEGIDEAWSYNNRLMMQQNSIVSGYFKAAGRCKKKSIVVEVMDERDKDKLFWETCLAS